MSELIRKSRCLLGSMLFLVAGATAAPLVISNGLNDFEWIATAPVVIVGRLQAEDRRWVEIEVERVLRGAEKVPTPRVRIDLRRANRDRPESAMRALRLDPDLRYVLLLKSSTTRGGGPLPKFDLVRGIAGARPLPEEGSQALVDALGEYVRIQEHRGDGALWRGLRELLESEDPRLLQTALELFLKFRRGDEETLPRLRSILAHPSGLVRERAARLIEVIFRDQPSILTSPEVAALREALASRARRDEAVAVRVAMTQALAALGGSEVEQLLDQIAESDPDQEVRYAAERAALVRRQAVAGSGRGSRGPTD